MSNIIFIIFAVIIVLIIGFIFYIWLIKKIDEKRDEWDVLRFMEKYPDRSALYIIKNDKAVARYSQSQVMPLASTVKIVIAAEYAKQATGGVRDDNQWIPLSDLEVYYIQGTDGGAHEAWLKHIKEDHSDSIKQDCVSLHEVVKGMIQFSSNANTEYLLDLLGLEQINENLSEIGMTQHEEIYFFGSSFLLPAYLKTEESLSIKQIKQRMEHMSMEEYKEYSQNIHDLLKHEKADTLIDETVKGKCSNMEIEKIISNRLSGGTVKEYAVLMNKVNQNNGIKEDVLILLRDFLEKTPNKYFNRIGFKGGSTLFIDTSAFYITDYNQDKFALAVFINDTKSAETVWITQKMDNFIFKILTDKSFQEKVTSRISN